jgi:hypothetical protein
MERQQFKDSNIVSAGWCEETQDLELEFASLAVYVYYGVPQNIWEAFLRAESKGKYHARAIMGNYRYQCIKHRPPKVKEETNAAEQTQATPESKKAKRKKKLAGL